MKWIKRLKSPRLMDLVWVLGLTLFAGFVFTDELVSRGAVLWDNIFFYSTFWNQLDSLNRFGEPAWWFPANQFGWPAYYYSILGDTQVANPPFVFIGLISWLAGRLGFVPSFYGLFTFYYAFLVPAMANGAAYSVLRQLLRDRAAVWFGVALMAFSPGTLLNAGDIGFLEPIAYSLFFLAAWIGFVRRPGDSVRFSLLALSLAVLGFTLGYPFLLWNVFFVPLSVLLVSVLPPAARAPTWNALCSRPLWHWGAVLALAGACAVPSLLTFSQTGDLIRATLGQQFYDFRGMRPGNPLEVLAISIPQFGFEWRSEGWSFMQAGKGYWVSMGYIALLALPLSAITLLYGKRWLRIAMVLTLAFYACMVSLSAWSPLFSAVIRFVRPFQSNSHWPDLGFRAGSFQLFIFMSAVGFELLRRGHARASRLLPWLIAGNLAGSVGVFIGFDVDKSLVSNPVFGLMVVASLLLLVLAVWLRSDRSESMRGKATGLLFAVTLVEMATFGYFHVRKTVETISWRAVTRVERQAPNSVGLDRIAPIGEGDYAEHILMYRSYYEMLQAKFFEIQLPQFMLFNSARVPESPNLKENVEREKKLIQNVAAKPYESLLLDSESAGLSDFAPFVARAPGVPAAGAIEVKELTYNKMDIKIKSSARALLFIRDAYSPYWTIRVNGKQVPVGRALFNFKAIVVPEGESEVTMRFSPPGVGWSIVLAYAILAGLTCAVAFTWFRTRRATRRLHGRSGERRPQPAQSLRAS